LFKTTKQINKFFIANQGANNKQRNHILTMTCKQLNLLNKHLHINEKKQKNKRNNMQMYIEMPKFDKIDI